MCVAKHMSSKAINVTGPAKTGHICTNYTCLEKYTFLGPYVR